MKARGPRPSVFIVSRCLDTPMKHEARVLEIILQICDVFDGIFHTLVLSSYFLFGYPFFLCPPEL